MLSPPPCKFRSSLTFDQILRNARQKSSRYFNHAFQNLSRALQSLPVPRAASDSPFVVWGEDVEHNRLLSSAIWLQNPDSEHLKVTLTMHRHTSQSFVVSGCHPNKLEICLWAEETSQDQRKSRLTMYYWGQFPCQSIKSKCDPSGDIFYYGEAISLPFYDAIFITGIIHNSLIRERAQHCRASFHSWMWKHTGIADATGRWSVQ